ELPDVRGLCRRGLDRGELLPADQNILLLRILVALHDFGALHVTVAMRAKQGLLEPRMTHIVELVEADALAARRCGHSHGNGNQPKRKVAFPDGRGHVDAPSTTGWDCARAF